jgi:excisionase family DNA binding protein
MMVAVKQAPAAPAWVTMKEAADRLGISADRMYRLLAKGVYDAERVWSGGNWRVFVDRRGWPIKTGKKP